MSIKVGDPVRLGPTSLSSLGIDHVRRGGEGVIAEISEDAVGTVYRIRLNRNGRIRAVRREQFVHHRPKKTRNKKR